MLLAIDPGNEQSAFVVFDGERPVHFGKWDNRVLLREIYVGKLFLGVTECAIETLKPRGMPTSFDEMQTQLWAGRFYEALFQARLGGEKFEPVQVFRMEVKVHVCGKVTANDSNIRAALIDRWGGQDKAIGGKRCRKCKGKGWYGRERTACPEWEHPPGPLYEVSGDVWAALAVAVTWWDTNDFRNRVVRPAEGMESLGGCPVRGCRQPIEFVCSYDYRRPGSEWRHVEKTRCRGHAAAFAAKHGITTGDRQ